MHADDYTRFQQAVLDPEQALSLLPFRATHPDEIAVRFAVYRNNSLAQLIDHLQALYPAVLRFLGEEYFRALAGEFVRQAPPVQPVLQEYGERFSGFVAGFPPLREYPWLADVARLEWARQQAFFAAEPAVLQLMHLRDLSAHDLLQSHFLLHPSVQALDSRWPVHLLWESQCAEPPAALPPEDAWAGEKVVVWRRDAGSSQGGDPDTQPGIRHRVLSAAEWRLFRGLGHGETLVAAARTADADLATLTRSFTQWVQDHWFRALPR